MSLRTSSDTFPLSSCPSPFRRTGILLAKPPLDTNTHQQYFTLIVKSLTRLQIFSFYTAFGCSAAATSTRLRRKNKCVPTDLEGKRIRTFVFVRLLRRCDRFFTNSLDNIQCYTLLDKFHVYVYLKYAWNMRFI